jgi:hypothetical protein
METSSKKYIYIYIFNGVAVMVIYCLAEDAENFNHRKLVSIKNVI